jgi:hypothetical protein
MSALDEICVKVYLEPILLTMPKREAGTCAFIVSYKPSNRFELSTFIHHKDSATCRKLGDITLYGEVEFESKIRDLLNAGYVVQS